METGLSAVIIKHRTVRGGLIQAGSGVMNPEPVGNVVGVQPLP